ncbi:beta-ketoacyl-[acyl-carrier-protein] synthase family protein [Kangiella japonica]|uniref:Beta-ketoacyl-[acyl-carrier-protein] synthase family protein n=1 Tax=Kangiella japonica TaxID=647384 RepID=A0ABP3CKX0_9GAMM
MIKCPVYLNQMALINALGHEHQAVFEKLIAGDTSGMVEYSTQFSQKKFLAGQVQVSLPTIPAELAKHNTRNNQLLLHCLLQLDKDLQRLFSQHSKHRIGIVIGTSTSGIAEGEFALSENIKNGAFPAEFDYSQIQMSSPAAFIADYYDITGPSYAISTACSSSGKVFASARSLIQNDFCDGVIVAGVDSLCDMTLNGFNALEAISEELSLPFSANRTGINIGEGAAVFLMTKEPSDIELLGVGESSDAHHISAPHPQGQGANEAMLMALKEAELSGEQIHYLNLHGTGTELNDSMESIAVSEALRADTPCSSTKPLTGHTLGAAGATELAFCWLALQQSNADALLPKHCYDGHYDESLPALNLVDNTRSAKPIKTAMSNSFAFGGNNVSVIIGRREP